jgi:hypothetical protein
MRSPIRVLLLSFLVLLTGCVARPVIIPEGITPDHLNENGSVVILSTGTKSPSIEHSCMLSIRSAKDGKWVQGLFMNNPTIPSHFPDHHGFLYILRLKPGGYYFFPEPTTPLTWLGKPSGVIVFEVKKSEVVYVGEVFHEFVSTSWFSSGRVMLTVNDQFVRDIEIFLQKNPAFRIEDVGKRMPYSVTIEKRETPKEEEKPETR